MNDLLPLPRLRMRPQALHVAYEKAGLTLPGPAIPWNAESVVVEANLKLPAARKKSDFSLQILHHQAIRPESLQDEADGRSRLVFRLPRPDENTIASLYWKSHPLGQIALTIFGEDEFLRDLRIQLPTIHARLGDATVACQTVVATQLQGVLATALIVAPSALAPIADMGLVVEFQSEGGESIVIPAHFTGSQLAARQALVTVVPPKFPRRVGLWTVNWKVGEVVLATQRLRCISRKSFQKSLQLIATRFAVDLPDEGIKLLRQLPKDHDAKRIGPCFILASNEAGAAGLCPVQVVAQVPGSVRPPVAMEQTVLIGDGPTLVVPGMLDADEARQVAAFELTMGGQLLGTISMSPAPEASFTSEGGFKPPTEYVWTPAAEDELSDRLRRLMEEK